MISKEMLKRCQNELRQAFCALPDDVQKAISADRDNAQLMEQNYTANVCCYHRANLTDPYERADRVWRLSPDTPTEPEWVEIDVKFDGWGRAVVLLSTSKYQFSITDCVSMSNFVYIIYQKDGIETLRTSIDAAFGTPVRVRFLKP